MTSVDRDHKAPKPGANPNDTLIEKITEGKYVISGDNAERRGGIKC